MSPTRGARLGAHEVVGLLGVGGMGEVHRATDTKLDRDVAPKILPDAFAADPDRLARFQRETHVLASLNYINHRNIAQIHGLEESDGVRTLVLELVEGSTLADRIAQGPIRWKEWNVYEDDSVSSVCCSDSVGGISATTHVTTRSTGPSTSRRRDTTGLADDASGYEHYRWMGDERTADHGELPVGAAVSCRECTRRLWFDLAGTL
jgi:hypothetical protein